ncbi:MAG: helix-turn-helix domain-containing protein [Marinifilaceae bacterium]
MGAEKLIQLETGIDGVSLTHAYSIRNKFPTHFHTTGTLGVVESGESSFRYRGKREVLRPGDLFFVQPFEPHSCQPCQEGDYSYKVISFPTRTQWYCPHFVLEDEELKAMVDRFHALVEFTHESGEKYTLFNRILELMDACMIPAPPVEKTDHIELFEKARQYIVEHCMESLDLKAIAEIACLSEFHFSRRFYQLFGLSPYAYYLVCKMKRAEKLLRENRSITATAFDLDFFDQSHFSRMFKKYMGVNPGKYLRERSKLTSPFDDKLRRQ